MTFIITIALIIIFTLGILFGIGLAQAAGKEMPRPPFRNNRTYVIGKVDAEDIRQAIKDADDNESWG